MIYDYLPLIVYRSDEVDTSRDKSKRGGFQNSPPVGNDWFKAAAQLAANRPPQQETNPQRPASQNLVDGGSLYVGALELEKAQLEDANNIQGEQQVPDRHWDIWTLWQLWVGFFFFLLSCILKTV
jgi:hypothetical protein